MNAFRELLLPSPMCCVIAFFCQVFLNSLNSFWVLPILSQKHSQTIMVTGYLHQMCSGIANYCEICRKNPYVWRKDKLELPLPCANSYGQSQLQPKSLYCIQPQKNSITYAKYMWKICVCIGMRYLCTIHFIAAYSSTTKENASPLIYIYKYI